MATSSIARGRRALWRAVKIAAVAAGTWFLALPQLPLAWAALGALAGINAAVVLTGAALAVGALVAYAQLMRTLLADGRRPGLCHTMGIITTSLGINRVMPAGAAAGGLMTFRLLERAGIRRSRAAFTMAVQSIGSALILNALLWLALIIALPVYGFEFAYVLAVGTGAIVFTFVALIADALYRRRSWLWNATNRLARMVPRTDPHTVIAHLDDQSERIRQLASNPATLRRAAGWGAVNWLLDAAALWVFLAAFGVTMSPIAVLVAFALANVIAIIPITPGGLGVVELTLTATLVGFGATAVPAALGVAAYRVFNYWAPIPASGLAYLAVRGTSVPASDIMFSAASGPFSAPKATATDTAISGRQRVDHTTRKAVTMSARITKRTLIAGAAGLGLMLGAGGLASAAQTDDPTPTTATADDDVQDPSYTASIMADEVEGQSEADEATALASLATISPDEAQAAAQAAVPGTVDKVELDNENGAVIYSVEISDGNGGHIDVKVDAGNGNVLHQDSGND